MSITIVPIMAHTVHAARRSQPGGTAKPVLSQSGEPRTQRLHPLVGRLLKLADRAGRTRSAQEVRKYVQAVWSRLLAWHLRRTSRQILNALDDRTLADIGLRRGEIETLLREMNERQARWYINP